MRRRLSSGFFFLGVGALTWGCATQSVFTPATPVDADGDGVADDLGKTVDADGDGIADLIDINGDGIMDGLGVDTDGDGIVDALAFDTDGDGIYDALDTDGDLIPDVFSELASSSQGPGTGVVGGSGGAPAAGAGGNEGQGTGGAPVTNTPRTLPAGWSGFVTSRVSDSTVAATYADFKTNHVESCSGGTIRVKRGSEDGNDTVSEGIAYGMLLAVAHDDQPTFDGIWAYYKKHAIGGIMPWKISGCEDAEDPNNATDAELDAAMALIQASCKWGGNYKTEAASLLGAVASLVVTRGSHSNLLPGKSHFSNSCVNASYVSPGYYRAFAAVDAANAGTWNKLAADSYLLLNSLANASTGLVPDWSSECDRENGHLYRYDAARTPWRVATDYLWYGTPAAKTFADRITNWVEGGPGITGIRDGYQVNGTVSGQYTSVVFTGAFATGALTHSQERADGYGQVLNNMRASNYFARSLKAIYVLLAAGKFDKTCH